MFGGRLDRKRAEDAERLLALTRVQLEQALAASKAFQDAAARDREFLRERLRDLEKNGGAAGQEAREELIRLRERTRANAEAMRALAERAKRADQLPARDAEIAALRERLAARERDLAEAREVLAAASRAAEGAAAAAAALERHGVRATLAPRPGGDGARALADALAAVQTGYAALAEILAQERLGTPAAVTADTEILRAHAKRVSQGVDVESERRAVLEQARLWVEDPRLRTYHVELLRPYATALADLLDRHRSEAAVAAARVALRVVRAAERESAGYLLRRSAALDGVVVAAPLALDRYHGDPRHALARMEGALAQRRGVGAIDFFHNVAQGAARAVRANEAGAALAAWLLSDATMALLDDARVMGWMAQATT